VIAHFGAIINLFNLIPIWQLDGSRGFHALTRLERGIVLSGALTLWLFTGTPMLLLIAAGAVYRLFTRDWQEEADRPGLLMFLGLLAALAIVSAISSAPASLPK
jgi:Zn-dependent protease